ncbi:MAG: hypothetical protein CMJ34_13960 [Phycisphaerae bacterium]|nr:hypothetical protein [Phycisphaerae bacterium]
MRRWPTACAAMALVACTGGQDPPEDAPLPTASTSSESSPRGAPARAKAKGRSAGKAKGKAKGRSNGQGKRKPSTQTPPPTIHRDNGLVYVTGSWVELGPRRVAPLVEVAPPPPADGGAAPSAAIGHHGEGGSARGEQGPSERRGRVPGRPRAGEAEKWTFRGGQDLSVMDVWVDAFWIDETEVSRSQYARFIEASGYRPPHVAEGWAAAGWNWDGSTPPDGTQDHPVVLVSWYDATEYCAWAGKRLPTEAEWQLAALGPWGHGRDYPWGNTYAADKLNHGRMETPNFDDSDGYRTTSPVGAFPSGESIYGARDMFGNAWEFTSDHRVDDWSHVSLTPAATTAHPTGVRQVHAAGPGLYVAVRGGSYFFDLRPNPGGERHRFLTEIRRKTSGFRCAKDDERTP